jgi:hypothetical protein
MTLPLAADMTSATGHHSQTLDGILAVRLSREFDCLAGSGSVTSEAEFRSSERRRG